MTIRELILELQKCDPDLPVFRRGYEGGDHEVSNIIVGAVRRGEHAGMDYYGPDQFYETMAEAVEHEWSDTGEFGMAAWSHPPVPAVKIE